MIHHASASTEKMYSALKYVKCMYVKDVTTQRQNQVEAILESVHEGLWCNNNEQLYHKLHVPLEFLSSEFVYSSTVR